MRGRRAARLILRRTAQNIAFAFVLSPLLLVLVFALFALVGVRVARRLRERRHVIDAEIVEED